MLHILTSQARDKSRDNRWVEEKNLNKSPQPPRPVQTHLPQGLSASFIREETMGDDRMGGEPTGSLTSLCSVPRGFKPGCGVSVPHPAVTGCYTGPDSAR